MKSKQNNPYDYFKAKHIADTLVDETSEENNERVQKIINETPQLADLLAALSNETVLKEKYEEMALINATKRKNVEALVKDILQRRRHRRLALSVSSVAVAALLLISFVLVLPSKEVSVAHYSAVETIAKTENKEPVLILSNGENVNLTETNDEVKIDGVVEVKKQGSTLIYGSVVPQENLKERFNTLIVPKMFTYTVSLEDGTEVTLNANSELKYPTRFIGEAREVYLKGEAFFKVKPSNKQFVVHIADVAVKVYGTEFNVCANNYNVVKTTLLSGSVGVSYTTNSGKTNEVMIHPNQMAMVNLISDDVAVKDVDAEIYRAWVDGYLSYYGDNLEKILEKLSMWYGVDFYFEDPKNKNMILTISFDNKTSLSEIISSIEQIVNVKFVKKGDKYVVM